MLAFCCSLVRAHQNNVSYLCVPVLKITIAQQRLGNPCSVALILMSERETHITNDRHNKSQAFSWFSRLCYPYYCQADIDAGEISDEASVVSSSPAPSPSDVTAVASRTTTLPRQPRVEIVKSITDVTAASGYDPLLTDAGDTFTYLITVSNTGNTWLSDVAVSDPMLDNGGGLGCGSTYAGNSSRFAPGGTFDCTVVLTLEQVHIDQRCVDSTANVRRGHIYHQLQEEQEHRLFRPVTVEIDCQWVC